MESCREFRWCRLFQISVFPTASSTQASDEDQSGLLSFEEFQAMSGDERMVEVKRRELLSGDLRSVITRSARRLSYA